MSTACKLWLVMLVGGQLSAGERCFLVFKGHGFKCQSIWSQSSYMSDLIHMRSDGNYCKVEMDSGIMEPSGAVAW